jgi:hypothetical protein
MNSEFQQQLQVAAVGCHHPPQERRRNSLFEFLLLLPNLRSADQGKHNTLVHWPSTSFSIQNEYTKDRWETHRTSNQTVHTIILITMSICQLQVNLSVISLWFTTLFLLYNAIQYNTTKEPSSPLRQRFTPDYLNATYNIVLTVSVHYSCRSANKRWQGFTWFCRMEEEQARLETVVSICRIVLARPEQTTRLPLGLVCS